MEHHYHQFTIRDFVLDDSFRQWVLRPDEQSMTFWHTFMLKHPEQQPTIDEAASLLLHLRANHDELTDGSKERIRQVLDEAFRQRVGNRPVAQSTVRPLWAQRRWVWRVAASMTGLFLLAGAAWYALRPAQQRIHTAFGENRTVSLPDGSTVLLNGNSTLTFADDWTADDTREVWLDGEGFFKVTKKQAVGGRLKFVTHTSALDITVLGTQFNVNTRRGSTAVALVEGRVRLARPGAAMGQIVELKPGQVASTQPRVETVEVRAEKTALHTGWTQHQFIFENTSLSQIAQHLHDTYGLDLVFEDRALARRRFTGNLSNQDVETLLTTLSITFDLTIQRDGERVILLDNQ